MSIHRKMARQIRKQQKRFTLHPLYIEALTEYRRRTGQDPTNGMQQMIDALRTIGIAAPGATVQRWRLASNWQENCTRYLLQSVPVG
jgi:hypothetical protein